MKAIDMVEANRNIARRAISKAYGGARNFVTPEVIDYGLTNGYAWELSTGRGLYNEPVYGVTVVNVLLGTKEYDLSKCFMTHQEALAYAATINDEMKEGK